MNVLEKILEEIEKKKQALEYNLQFEVGQASINEIRNRVSCLKQAEEIIRSHMDDCKTFEFDFTGVKSFDCQCGRHYVNTASDDWIPVEERLPEETTGKYYPEMIVTTSYGAVTWGFYRVMDKQWYIYSNIHNEFVKAGDKEIVAWRPLPEPYKSKK